MAEKAQSATVDVSAAADVSKTLEQQIEEEQVQHLNELEEQANELVKNGFSSVSQPGPEGVPSGAIPKLMSGQSVASPKAQPANGTPIDLSLALKPFRSQSLTTVPFGTTTTSAGILAELTRRDDRKSTL